MDKAFNLENFWYNDWVLNNHSMKKRSGARRNLYQWKLWILDNFFELEETFLNDTLGMIKEMTLNLMKIDHIEATVNQRIRYYRTIETNINS